MRNLSCQILCRGEDSNLHGEISPSALKAEASTIPPPRLKTNYTKFCATLHPGFMDRNFGGVIWTNHALQRLREHGIKQGDAWAAFRRPEQSRRGTKEGAWVYYKTWGNEKIEVVAKQNDKKEWVILSVWSRPIYQTTRAVKPPLWWDRLLEEFLRRSLGWFRRS